MELETSLEPEIDGRKTVGEKTELVAKIRSGDAAAVGAIENERRDGIILQSHGVSPLFQLNQSINQSTDNSK